MTSHRRNRVRRRATAITKTADRIRWENVGITSVGQLRTDPVLPLSPALQHFAVELLCLMQLPAVITISD